MPKPPSLISALILPCLGLSLLFCLAAFPLPKLAAVPAAGAGGERQSKPAEDNATRLILLRCQYGNCARCRRHRWLARGEPEAARWRKNTLEAIRLYNQVADDTDPSAFALTPLPRRLRAD